MKKDRVFRSRRDVVSLFREKLNCSYFLGFVDVGPEVVVQVRHKLSDRDFNAVLRLVKSIDGCYLKAENSFAVPLSEQ